MLFLANLLPSTDKTKVNKKVILSEGTTARCGHLYRKLAHNPRATQ